MELTAAINQIIVIIVQVLIVPLLAYIIASVAPVVRKWAQARIASLNAIIVANHMEILRDTVITAIGAAEKKFQDATSGPEKKAYALNVINQALANYGISFPTEQVEAELEQAVRLGLHKADGSDAEEGQSLTPLGFDTTASVPDTVVEG